MSLYVLAVNFDSTVCFKGAEVETEDPKLPSGSARESTTLPLFSEFLNKMTEAPTLYSFVKNVFSFALFEKFLSCPA